jgi:hypothetical protein
MLEYKSVGTYLIKLTHALVSYTLIAFTQIVMLSGLYYANYSATTYLFYVHLIILICILVSFEIIYRNWRKRSMKLIEQLEKKMLPEMSIEDFIVSESKLVLCQNFVLNVSKFSFDHPGGRKIFYELDKKDILKYLHETTLVYGSNLSHVHSFAAFKVIEDLAVAKLAKSRYPRILFEASNSEEDLDRTDQEFKRLSST